MTGLFGGCMLDVLYEDNHLLAVNKAAMLPTMGVRDDRESLLAVAKEFIRRKYEKPGNIYLGIVSRLDAPVTGLVLLAKTSKAAARLSAAFRERRVKKTYLAVVEGTPTMREGVLENFLRKDERHRKVHATHESAPGAQLARLRYRVVHSGEGVSLVEVEPETGRKHQIRVQLAKAGTPIVGDRKYGASETFPSGIALHAYRLELEHPVRKDVLQLAAPIPVSWLRERKVKAALPPGFAR
jgi:23S rRNA pseudouridine1911/1915/1917 synthase